MISYKTIKYHLNTVEIFHKKCYTNEIQCLLDKNIIFELYEDE